MKNLKIGMALVFCMGMGLLSCTSNTSKNSNVDTTANTPIDSGSNINANDNTDFELTPGVEAGKTKINEDTEEVFKVLGKPDSSDAAMQKMVAFWFNEQDDIKHSTSIYAVRDTGEMPKARVQQIRVTSPKFKTQSGIGVSSSLDEIKKAYSIHKIQSFKTVNNQLDVWDSNDGIAFEIGNEKECTAVIIHKKGEELKGTYLPLR